MRIHFFFFLIRCFFQNVGNHISQQITSLRLGATQCHTTLLFKSWLVEKRWIHAFLKRISVKVNATDEVGFGTHHVISTFQTDYKVSSSINFSKINHLVIFLQLLTKILIDLFLFIYILIYLEWH